VERELSGIGEEGEATKEAEAEIREFPELEGINSPEKGRLESPEVEGRESPVAEVGDKLLSTSPSP